MVTWGAYNVGTQHITISTNVNNYSFEFVRRCGAELNFKTPGALPRNFGLYGLYDLLACSLDSIHAKNKLRTLSGPKDLPENGFHNLSILEFKDRWEIFRSHRSARDSGLRESGWLDLLCLMRTVKLKTKSVPCARLAEVWSNRQT